MGNLVEKIVQVGNKWQVQSEKGRNLGTYDTKEDAEKRLKQVEYFKHMNEGLRQELKGRTDAEKWCYLVYSYLRHLDPSANRFCFMYIDNHYPTRDNLVLNRYIVDPKTSERYHDYTFEFHDDGSIRVLDYTAGDIIKLKNVDELFAKYFILPPVTSGDLLKYLEDGMDESLNESNNLENSVKEFIIKNWEDNIHDKPVYGPSYITPYGSFIDIIGIAEDMGEDDFPESFPCHGALQTIMANAGICELGGRYDDGSPILRDLGYIRINDVEQDNNYIELSDVRPTEAQYEALERWLDENQRHWRKVFICTPMMKEAKEYNYIDYTTDEIIKKIKRWYTTGNLTEALLLEKTRTQLIDKSKKSDDYAKGNQSKGRNRWERRTRSRIAATVADYNHIDMNKLFKQDILEFGVKVQGETNNYVVTIVFKNILKYLKDQVARNKNKLEFKCVVRAIMDAFNREDVFVGCSCPDFKYRQQYWATQGNYNSIQPQPSNGKMIANPGDTKGAGCKHVNLVLSNLNWALKLASTIHNYINYCKDHMENNYARYIFPVIYGQDYEGVIQMDLFDYNPDGSIKTELIDDEEILNLANAIGKVRGRFRSDIKVNNQKNFKGDFEKEESEFVDTENQ